MNRLAVLAAWVRARYRPPFRSREALERWQDAAARRLLATIVPRSPFYARHFAGHDLADWRQLPTIDKPTMMANLTGLNTRGIDADEAMRVALAAEASRDFRPEIGGVTVGLSSGTSGSRGLFLVTPEERLAWAGTILARVLPDRILGLRPHRIAFFLRANSNLYETVGSSRIAFTFFDLVEPLDGHVGRLADLKPTILVAPPSVLRALADSGVRIAPDRVVSVAEVLDPLDEAVIRRTFGRTVHQVYQATEGLLGSTCAFGTLHLAEDVVAIQREPLGDGRFSPIVTDLHREGQPIVRYRLNDVLVEREVPCLCGSVMVGLERVEGRADDCFHVRTKSGWRVLFPDVVRHAIVAASNLTAFGVRQVTANQVELYVDGPFDAAATGLATAWTRLGAAPPEIRRLDAWTPVGPRKLKRVECLFRRDDA